VLEAEQRNQEGARGEYEAMRADLEAVLAGLGNRDAIVNLINGVLLVRLSTLPPNEEREKRLDQGRQALERYLNPPATAGFKAPTGLDRVRGNHFLAVVRYHQSLVPPFAPEGTQQLKSREILDDAARMMRDIVEPTGKEYVGKYLDEKSKEHGTEFRQWMAFGELYMGLISTRQGNDEVERGRSARGLAYFDAAESYMRRAWEHDMGQPFDVQKAAQKGQSGTASGTPLPQIAADQLASLAKAKQVTPTPPGDDFMIELRTGMAYDDNVPLLGKDTSLPRGIGRKEDFRVGGGINLNYTLNLGKFDESGTKELDRWTIGFLGRSSAVWNAEVHEYNEQDYGGSIAIQYEAMRQQSGSPSHGPLFLGFQYDYDYFLLGNKGFLGMHRVTPRATLYTFDQRLETTLGFRYEERNYFEPLTANVYDRDGNYFSIGIRQSVRLVDMTDFYTKHNIKAWGLANDPVNPATMNAEDPKQDSLGYQRWLTPYIGFEYQWDSTAGAEFDSKRPLLLAGVEVPLPYGVLFRFSGEWEWQNYQGFRGGSLIDYHRRGRNDFVQAYAVGLERAFVLVPGCRVNRQTTKIDRLVMILRGDMRFIDDDSNVEDRLGESIFSYDRAIYGLSVAFQFN
jgi:hypothetical protein